MEIPKAAHLINQVFSITNNHDFEQAALAVFRFQYNNNPVYNRYCHLLKKEPGNIHQVHQIPFLPISFFKSHDVVTTSFDPQILFESSGTSGQLPSRHLVKETDVYIKSFQKGFETFYGAPSRYCILGLLPSYLERGNSSLVYMVSHLIKESGHHQSGFYLYDFDKLAQVLHGLEAQEQPTLLIGVTYALLDFAERHPMLLQHTIVMETGGMKGRKKELVRDDVHTILKTAFGVAQIHSEYGMTELLSQAYAREDGLFKTPPWMKVFLRYEDDPLTIATDINTGGINIIDLANIYSCAFIATEDVARMAPDGSFSVLGRLDHAAVRGCSLLSL